MFYIFILYIKLNIRFGYKTTKSFLSSQKYSLSTCHNNTVCACVSRVTAERSLNKTKLRGWGWPQSVCFTQCYLVSRYLYHFLAAVQCYLILGTCTTFLFPSQCYFVPRYLYHFLSTMQCYLVSRYLYHFLKSIGADKVELCSVLATLLEVDPTSELANEFTKLKMSSAGEKRFLKAV